MSAKRSGKNLLIYASMQHGCDVRLSLKNIYKYCEIFFYLFCPYICSFSLFSTDVNKLELEAALYLSSL